MKGRLSARSADSKTKLCRGAVAAAVGAAVFGFASPASAQADSAQIAGEIALPSAGDRGEPPARTSGFVSRQRHPAMPPEPYDPRPHMAVVLEGAPGGSGRADVEYPIAGASFASPLQPVQADVPFEIPNRSEHAPRLYAVGDPDLVPGDPINPGTSREATAESSYQRIAIRDRETGHIEGAVVAFPHPYFSAVEADGSFEIDNVPEGTYQLRVWYRDGWLDLEPKSVDVPDSGRVSAPVTVPAELNTVAPEGDG